MGSKANIMCDFYYHNYYKRKIGYINFQKKYLKYFEYIEDTYGGTPNFDPKNYIAANMIDGFKYPQQLTTNACYLNARNAKIYKPEEDEQIVFARQMKSFVEQLKGQTVEQYLKNGFNCLDLYSIKDESLIRFLCFSKNFGYFLDENEGKFDKIIRPENYRARVNAYPRLVNKLKEILGDDWYGNKED